MLQFLGFFLLFRFSLSRPLTSSHAFSPSIHHSSPLLAYSDQVRHRHLYTDGKLHGLFVEILSDGSVSATQTQTPYTVLELKAVRAGYTVIRGVKSDLYLCVNAAGLLHAVSVFVDADCSFNEMVQPDGYTHFLSAHHGLPVSLSFNVPPGKHTLTLSRFLPLTTDQFMEKQESAETSSFLSAPDFDSDDPLGVKNTHQNPRSPLFHINQ
ncbi:fibroblast growth factor 19-like isoform X3 [Silurus meridionalis]|uniref:fibroblast growth factor 19-like isoform X3 n=1 Tax=Silurus meridionalis TaxID=175797 RepID=UPI001EEB7151|nr:fibroblast growth factor 19-like isoform X3 [Silurus meridionalis]